MSTRPRLAQLATDALAAESIPVAPDGAERRTAALAILAREIRRSQRRRVLFRGLAGAGAVAAGALVAAVGMGASRHSAPLATAPSPLPTAGAIGNPLAGKVLVLRANAAFPMTFGTPISPGDRVLVPADGRGALLLPTGTSLIAEEGADLSVVDEGLTQTFALRGGSVRAEVAKLGAAQRFVVRTVDSEVEVRGTKFRVSLVTPDPACGHGTRTRVSVTEGVVVVRSGGDESRVLAGESWPSSCGDVHAPSNIAVAASVARSPAVTGAAHPTESRALVHAAIVHPQESVAPISDLAAQNDLFQSGMAAKRRSDDEGALLAFGQYLAQYPRGELVEHAEVERMRLLAKKGAPGLIAARRYLERHPAGFARAEAEAIVARPAP